MKSLEIIKPFTERLDNVFVFKDGAIHTQKLKAPFDQIKVGTFDDLTEDALKTLKSSMLNTYDGVDNALTKATSTTFI